MFAIDLCERLSIRFNRLFIGLSRYRVGYRSRIHPRLAGPWWIRRHEGRCNICEYPVRRSLWIKCSVDGQINGIYNLETDYVNTVPSWIENTYMNGINAAGNWLYQTTGF